MAVLAVAVATLVVLTGGAALANTITCTATVDCYGTDDPETMQGGAGINYEMGLGDDDVLYGEGGSDGLYGDTQADPSRDGDDKLYGGPGGDALGGGGGSDLLVGGGGNDVIFAKEGTSWTPGEDTVKAGKGDDEIEADDGYKDFIDCGSGTDKVTFDKNLDKIADNCEKRHEV
jgi:Ca2+-binding RTX toxin-like protein